MVKKILVLLLLFLCACSNNSKQLEYVDPVKDVFIFGELDSDVQNRIKEANGNKEYRNYQFLMHDDDFYDGEFIDINNKQVNLSSYERIILEIVSVRCSHCRKQLHLTDKILEHDDVLLIQYFNVGDRQEIIEFYEDEGINIPDNVIVVEHDKKIENYIRHYLKIENYPTFIAFDHGKVVFDAYGELDENSIDKFYEISYLNPLTEKDLCDKQGTYVPGTLRTIEDLKESLSEENQKKLESLPGKSEELSLKLMGNPFDPVIHKRTSNTVYFNEVDNYQDYMDKPLVVLYENLSDDSAQEKVSFINELIKSNDRVKFILVLNEGTDQSSEILKRLENRVNCPVVSMLASIPEALMIYDIDVYPSAIFINKGTFTGAYLSIDNIELFNNAVEMFLTDNSIAYKDNN